MRRLAGENGDCQTCDEENMTGCLIDYLIENQRKSDAINIDQSYCYSNSQTEGQCATNYPTWKKQINNLIGEDNYSILSCLFTHHCCSAFDYKYEEAEEEEEEIN